VSNLREAQFHSFVAKWLSENGYYYEHEVKMPEYGRADFIAKHQDGHTLIVECKVGANAADGRSIIQLVDYCRQLEGSYGAYALPEQLVTESIRALCVLYKVQIIAIDVSQPIDDVLFSGDKEKHESPFKQKRVESIVQQIKQVARQQMAQEGAAALSLRAIAREIGVTAPALYRYFPNRDALITSLIIDAYNELADLLEITDKAQEANDYKARTTAFALTYRKWAVDNPPSYHLIFGSPIPGYAAPSEFTIPPARRTYMLIVKILSEAYVAKKLDFNTSYQGIPESILSHIQSLHKQDLPEIPPEIVYISLSGWAQVHGAVSLELAGHLGEDTEMLYQYIVFTLIRDVGLK
jgi:AcrR family transcriptional regulator